MKLKYGIVIATMFDSIVFRLSLQSLLDSDFMNGINEITVVEDGHLNNRECEEFCYQYRHIVNYYKHDKWNGIDELVNEGFKRIVSNPEILIYSHSDVYFPKNWFSELNAAWEKVYSGNKVGMLNLGYKTVRFHFFDIFKILSKNEPYEVAFQKHIIHNAVNKDKNKLFGLAVDPYNSNRLGRTSIVTSFLADCWKELHGFSNNMGLAMDVELQLNLVRTKRWNLWLSNQDNLIHVHLDPNEPKNLKSRSGQDTLLLLHTEPEKFKIFMEMFDRTYENFNKKYGFGLNDYLDIDYGKVKTKYEDYIIERVNDMRFEELDFIFDEIEGELNEIKRTLVVQPDERPEETGLCPGPL